MSPFISCLYKAPLKHFPYTEQKLHVIKFKHEMSNCLQKVALTGFPKAFNASYIPYMSYTMS